MKRSIFALLLVALVAIGAPAFAELCAIDAVPAASLLLPYFEVDLDNAAGINTLFSVNNASATPAVVHVVMWTNWSAPTIDFDIYLTGYDVQTVNLRDVFNGNLPVTASTGQDPNGGAVGIGISPNSNIGIPAITDVNFASCTGLLPYNNPVVQGTALDRLLNGHTGNPVVTLGGACLGADLGDNVARGYITMDNANQCSLVLDPNFPGYFISGGVGVVSNDNQLWGDFFYVDEVNNFAQGETLVHLEANNNFTAATIPLTDPNTGGFVVNVANATNYTFYGRYTQALGGGDNREPLGTTWAVRYLQGGQFSGGTDLIVWRDSTANNVLPFGAACGNSSLSGPDWFPLNETEVAAFDEIEQVEELCFFLGGVISPPDEQDPACFPYETGRYPVGADAHPFEGVPNPLEPSEPFGWLYLNLNLPSDAPTGDVDFPAATDPGVAQSWVMAIHDADGRFSVGYSANKLTSACSTANLTILP